MIWKLLFNGGNYLVWWEGRSRPRLGEDFHWWGEMSEFSTSGMETSPHFPSKETPDFRNTIISYKSRSLIDNCLRLLQIWCKYFLHDEQIKPSKKSYILWSHLLLVLLFHFFTYCFQNMC